MPGTGWDNCIHQEYSFRIETPSPRQVPCVPQCGPRTWPPHSGLYRHFPAPGTVSTREPGAHPVPAPRAGALCCTPSPIPAPQWFSRAVCPKGARGGRECLFGVLTVMPAVLGARGARFPEQWKAVLPKKDLPLTLHGCQASHSHSCQRKVSLFISEPST